MKAQLSICAPAEEAEVVVVTCSVLARIGCSVQKSFWKMWILDPNPDLLDQNLQGIVPGNVIFLKFLQGTFCGLVFRNQGAKEVGDPVALKCHPCDRDLSQYIPWVSIHSCLTGQSLRSTWTFTGQITKCLCVLFQLSSTNKL